LPAPDAGGQVAVADLVDGVVRYVDEVAAKTSELDGAAAVVLGEAVEELRELGDARRPLGEALGLVPERVSSLTVGGDRARPGHLHVSMLRQAGYAGRPDTFVVGLEEGGVFPPVLEDPVLLDAERQALHPALATSHDCASEALVEVLSRLAVLGPRVCLSYSCRDVREHRETFPSWLMLQAVRLLNPGRQWTYRDLEDALGEPVSLVPSRPGAAASEAGWWLAQLRGAGEAALPAVHAAFSRLAAGEAAEARRDGPEFTAWDGLVPDAGPRLDPRTSGQAASATALEAAAGCPFRLFLTRALRIEPIADEEPERDRWLDPLTLGSLLHGLYAAVMRWVREDGRLDRGRHGAHLRALAEARLAELRAAMPPPSGGVFERERRTLLRDLDIFLDLEGREPDVTPVGFEVGFGERATDREPLASPDPVVVDLGHGLRFPLRGRIDRVDRLADRAYRVTDYKTGGYWRGDFQGRVRGGRMLQHALYALAAEQLLRRRERAARVSQSCYYLPTARGGGERVVCPPVDRRELRATLADLLDTIRAGAFLHTTDERDCKWCDQGRACGARSLERAATKLAEQANTVLDPVRRLAARE
jgi:ATP-dependent helicase/nuclease subunit B